MNTTNHINIRYFIKDTFLIIINNFKFPVDYIEFIVYSVSKNNFLSAAINFPSINSYQIQLN